MKFQKQEAHGPQCSPEKTVQINKHIWLYHNVDYEKKKNIIIFMRIKWVFEQNLIPFTQGCLVSNLAEIGPVVLEKKIF